MSPTTAAVLSVGSEILLGDLTDTNATWLSQRLTELGIAVTHHLAARDQLDQLVDSIRWLAVRVDVLVVGGGLGPTHDDLTREAVAAAAGVELEERAELIDAVAGFFDRRGLVMPARNLQQARVPVGADTFDPVGTAPAFALSLPDATRIYCLPGVSWELHELFERHVAPELLELVGAGATVTRIVRATGVGESTVAETVAPIVERAELDGSATVSLLATSEEVQVRLTVTADDPHQARESSQPLVDEIVELLGAGVAGVDEGGLEATVVRAMLARGQTVATAESCTAGEIAARLARVPGASDVLRGGAVVYATDVKHRLLGVDLQLIDQHGPISAPVTEALAARSRAVFGADWGIGVTGAAGPTAPDGIAVGSCFWALAHPDGHVEVHGRQVAGDRPLVKARVTTAAIDLLRRRLAEAG